MFSRKKRFWEKKGFYGGILTAALAAYSFSLILFPSEDVPEDKKTQDTSQSVVKTEKIVDSNNQPNKEQVDNGKDKGSYEKNSQTYYLIKEENGLIKIYQCDSYGGTNLMRTTDIAYALLYEEDQAMFSNGIKVSSEDELMTILQDFES